MFHGRIQQRKLPLRYQLVKMYKLKLPLFNPVQFLIELKTDTIFYTAPCFLVVLSPSFWNAPNSTCSVTSAPIPVNTSRKIVRPPCHK